MFRRRDRISLQQRKRLNKKRQRRGILFLVLEFLILAVLVLAAFMMYKLDHLNHNTLDESSLELHETPKGYTNVALFGLDSRDGELSGGVRSDSIMIVSIKISICGNRQVCKKHFNFSIAQRSCCYI